VQNCTLLCRAVLYEVYTVEVSCYFLCRTVSLPPVYSTYESGALRRMRGLTVAHTWNSAAVDNSTVQSAASSTVSFCDFVVVQGVHTAALQLPSLCRYMPSSYM